MKLFESRDVSFHKLSEIYRQRWPFRPGLRLLTGRAHLLPLRGEELGRRMGCRRTLGQIEPWSKSLQRCFRMGVYMASVLTGYLAKYLTVALLISSFLGWTVGLFDFFITIDNQSHHFPRISLNIESIWNLHDPVYPKCRNFGGNYST